VGRLWGRERRLLKEDVTLPSSIIGSGREFWRLIERHEGKASGFDEKKSFPIWE
jgi:hypothetical protein